MPISNPTAVAFLPRSSLVEDMQKLVATGDFVYAPGNINDGDTGTIAYSDIVNQYCEIQLYDTVYISQYRIFSYHVNHNEDGHFKIQYRDMTNGNWVDWKTGIPTTIVNNWAAWDTTPARVYTNGLRLVCTAVDTGLTRSNVQELEVKD